MNFIILLIFFSIILSSSKISILFVSLIVFDLWKMYKKRKSNKVADSHLNLLFNKYFKRVKLYSISLNLTNLIVTTTYYLAFYYILHNLNSLTYKLLIIFCISTLLLYSTMGHSSPLSNYLLNCKRKIVINNFDILFFEQNIENINNTKVLENIEKGRIIKEIEKQKNLLLNIVYEDCKLMDHLVFLGSQVLSIAVMCSWSWSIKLAVIYYLFFRIYVLKQMDLENEKINEKYENKRIHLLSDLISIVCDIKNNHPNTFKADMKENSRIIAKNDYDQRKMKIDLDFKNSLLSKILYFSIIFYYVIYYNFKIPSNVLITLVIIIIMIDDFGLYGDLILSSIYNSTIDRKEYSNGIKYINTNTLRHTKQELDVKNNEIFIHGTQLIEKLVYIKGKSGCGKTQILNSLYYDKLMPKITFFRQSQELIINDFVCKDIIGGVEKDCNPKDIQRTLEIVCLDKTFKQEDILIKPSGGEIQRLKLGRCIYKFLKNNTKILILDEPDNNIDSVTFLNIMKNIYSLKKAEKIIFTTHKPFAKDIIPYQSITIQKDFLKNH